jgi:hypothetical protein
MGCSSDASMKFGRNSTTEKSVLYAVLTAAKVQDKAVFPESLFGVQLGGIYTVGQDNIGTMPVKNFTGMKQFLGSGINYYFEPLKDYKAFKYVEKRKSPDDAYFETSFRLYLFPIIPSTLKNAKELLMHNLKWEVATIAWSDTTEKKEDAYFLAIDLCKNIRIDLEREPKIIDIYEYKRYRCTFVEGHKELTIDNSGEDKYFALSYTKTVFDKKDNAIDTMLRKYHMKEIKPY